MDYITPIGEESLGIAAVYKDENPTNGTKGSVISSKAVEVPQREILNVIVEAGLTPSSEDTTQLKQAINKLISSSTPNIATSTTAGVVKPDNDSIVVDSNGIIRATAQVPDIATTTKTGIVKPDGTTITIDAAGTLKATAQMPGVATNSSVGVSKPDGISITVDGNGTLSTSIDVLTSWGTLAAGTTDIPLTFSYDTSKKNLAVFISGILQPPTAWDAISSTSIRLSESLPEDVSYYVTNVTSAAESSLTAIYNNTLSSVTTLANMMMGQIISVLAADTYIPNGCLPTNGSDYTRDQFAAFFDNYLITGKLMTCTYTEYAAQVALTGNCAKFALDSTNQKFKVPLLKDGDSITQANSSTELGKSYKAGLPDIQGYVGVSVNSGTGAVSNLGDVGLRDYPSGTSPCYSKQFKASSYNNIYGSSSSVTDEQIRLRHFVVVATIQSNAAIFDWARYITIMNSKANTDLSNISDTAIASIKNYAKASETTLLGTCTAAGSWVINNVKPNVPLKVYLLSSDPSNGTAYIRTTTGSSGLAFSTVDWVLGVSSSYVRTNVAEFIPTATSVTLNITNVASGASLRAYQ